MNLLVTLGTVDAETWKTVGIVAGILAGIALVLVIAILIVGKVFKVDVDEKVTKILEDLAGANCGGCGCSGCSGFAQKLACGKADLSDCHVTSPEKKAEIAKILGIEVKEEAPTVAVVKCKGGANAFNAFEYKGNPTCAACNGLLGGNKMCKTACLGCGDCANVCPEAHYRTHSRKRSHLCCLLFPLQGERSYHAVQGGLHRLRHMRKELPSRCYNHGRQSARH